MRLGIAAVAVGAALAMPLPATAETFSSCWVTTEWNPATFQEDQVTRCRIAGGSTVDYATDNAVPSVLYANLGTDANGPCWYLTSAETSYIFITRYADGNADIGYDLDPSIPGGVIVVGPNLPRCTSEPTPSSDPAAEAWEYVMAYIHDPPSPDLSPAPGQGVTGLTTYVGVTIPDDHDATLSSGGGNIEVEIDVDAVVVSWGDGNTATFPADQGILAGYPDGSATHVYETKDAEGLSLVVEFDWTARWRLTGGAWTTLSVPNTETVVSYPIAEVVSRLGD